MTKRELAASAADEAMDALWSVLWSGSFDEQRLRADIQALILSRIEGAKTISEVSHAYHD